MMSTINIIDNKEYSFTKGSLDSILTNCTYYLEDNKVEVSKVELSYFEYKKYYVWIKDKDSRISERVVIDKEIENAY